LNVSGPDTWKKDGRLWVFHTCPWNADHTDRSAFIIQMGNGAIKAGCHHQSCQDQGWSSLKRLYPAMPQRLVEFPAISGAPGMTAQGTSSGHGGRGPGATFAFDESEGEALPE